MTKTYQIHGACCDTCLKKISKGLLSLKEVKKILHIDLNSVVIIFHSPINNINSAFVEDKFWLSQIPQSTNFIVAPRKMFSKIITKYSQ
jgi:hypothetical protein